MSELSVLDLFSGIGGFSLAAHNVGFKVVAHCEIEDFPYEVLRHRFPSIPIFRDVRYLTKDIFYERTGLREVDIICGGSPCQDYSLAGKRLGNAGERSILFQEQIRIARELNAKYIVWENVPGVFSSNKGKDFERVLCEFTGWDAIDYQKWETAGCIMGRTRSDYSVSYRVFDTRYFGIPQRRRRIYLVANLGGIPRPEILFESEVLRGDNQAFSKKGEETPGFINEGVECSDREGTIVNQSKVEYSTFEVFDNHAQDARYSKVDVSPTITSRSGTGGNNLPLCVHSSVKETPNDACNKVECICIPSRGSHINVSKNIAQTLCATDHKGVEAVCIAENIINRKDENGGNGIGAQEDISYTLNATGVHAVASSDLILRRLTPLECERLQGFPDDWTKIPYKGKSMNECPDSLRYKACGNAIRKK